MGFWTRQKIEWELKGCPVDQSPLIAVADGSDLGRRLDDARIEQSLDCNAFTLRIGDEIYISPSESADRAPGEAIVQLKDKESFTIPAGQFAFLTTEEVVKVPAYAMAFISIKTTLKFRGVVNVSGFHVDPGFHGQITFAVFNAGPRPVTLRRGMDAFLIWFADLSDTTAMVSTQKPYARQPQPALGLDPNRINSIEGEVHSFKGLLARMEEGEKLLSDRLHALEKEHAVIRWAATILVGLASAYIGWKLRGQ